MDVDHPRSQPITHEWVTGRLKEYSQVRLIQNDDNPHSILRNTTGLGPGEKIEFSKKGLCASPPYPTTEHYRTEQERGYREEGER